MRRKAVSIKKPLHRRSLPQECKDMITIMQWVSYYTDYKDDIHHVPNEGKRTVIEGATLKRMGMTPGFSDIFVAIPQKGYHGLFIELKSIRGDGSFGKPSQEQQEFIDRKNERGYLAKVCYGVDEVFKLIEWYLDLVNGDSNIVV